jgi:hypothetical protein
MSWAIPHALTSKNPCPPLGFLRSPAIKPTPFSLGFSLLMAAIQAAHTCHFFSAPGQPRRPTTRTIRLMGEQSGSTGEPVLRLTNAHIQKNTRMRIHRGPSRQWWWRYRGDVTHDAWLTPSSLKTIFLFSGAQAWLLGRVR